MICDIYLTDYLVRGRRRRTRTVKARTALVPVAPAGQRTDKRTVFSKIWTVDTIETGKIRIGFSGNNGNKRTLRNWIFKKVRDEVQMGRDFAVVFAL